MSEISEILASGDAAATDRLLPLVYQELRRLASERLRREEPGLSLQATDLVHEAYLRLVGGGDIRWDGKGHFFAAAAEAMRRVLINRARDRTRLKRGGNRIRLDLSRISLSLETPDEALIALDQALQRLAEEDLDAAELVKLKFFGGLTLKDAAATKGLTRRQGDRLWAFARAWLFDFLRED